MPPTQPLALPSPGRCPSVPIVSRIHKAPVPARVRRFMHADGSGRRPDWRGSALRNPATVPAVAMTVPVPVPAVPVSDYAQRRCANPTCHVRCHGRGAGPSVPVVSRMKKRRHPRGSGAFMHAGWRRPDWRGSALRNPARVPAVPMAVHVPATATAVYRLTAPAPCGWFPPARPPRTWPRSHPRPRP